MKRRVFSNEFKLQVLSEADQGISIPELNRRYELSGGMIAKWRRQFNKLKQIPSQVKVQETPRKPE